MRSSHTLNYGLYQTFAPPDESGEVTSSLSKKDLSVAQKKELLQKLSTLTRDQTDAVFMLIVEHSRRYGNFEYNPTDIHLPYGLEQKAKTITFDLKKLPIPLRWILWRFSNVITTTSSDD